MTKIIDVAQRAGVSTATVSRALSRPELVSEPVRARVQAAVKELGYQLNVAGRSLRTLRSLKILVTVPDISNPFFSNVIRGAEQAARASGFSVVLGDTSHDPALEDQYAAMVLGREVDGLVFLGHRLPAPLAALTDASDAPPIVNGCEYSPGLGVSGVHIDNASAGHDATRLLIELGHRRIGVITGPLESPLSRDRLSGVEAAASQAGPHVELSVRQGDFSVEAGFDEARRLIAEGVRAIFCFSDEMAIGALHAGRAEGLSCPEDISVIGFDDIRFAEHTAPPLTTIRQPAADIGRRAVELLVQHIRGELDAPKVLTLPHELIVRGSTGRARGRPLGRVAGLDQP
jgi:LacI family repressor for deo operon, udp, cdd, tsx, nupC, and nupG